MITGLRRLPRSSTCFTSAAFLRRARFLPDIRPRYVAASSDGFPQQVNSSDDNACCHNRPPWKSLAVSLVFELVVIGLVLVFDRPSDRVHKTRIRAHRSCSGSIRRTNIRPNLERLRVRWTEELPGFRIDSIGSYTRGGQIIPSRRNIRLMSRKKDVGEPIPQANRYATGSAHQSSSYVSHQRRLRPAAATPRMSAAKAAPPIAKVLPSIPVRGDCGCSDFCG